MVYICIGRQVTQNPYSSKFKLKRHHLTQEGRGRQVQAQCDPQLHRFFKYGLCSLSIWPS